MFAVLTALNRVKIVVADSASHAIELTAHLSPKGIAPAASPYRSV
jgi:hypothetical protein